MKFKIGDLLISDGGVIFEILDIVQNWQHTFYVVNWLSTPGPGSGNDVSMDVVDKHCRKLTKLDKVLR